jgi:hypothetical protein
MVTRRDRCAGDRVTKKTTVERHKQTKLCVEVGRTPYARQARESYHEDWWTAGKV